MDTNSKKEAVSQSEQPVKLVDVSVDNENVALNLLVGFVNMAQQKGVYNIQESAKIWECVKVFQKQQTE